MDPGSGSHGRAALAGVEAGLAVFCEKPLAHTLAEAGALAGARLLLGYMKLYDPAFERALELVAGRPAASSVEVTVLHPPAASKLAHARLLPRPADVPGERLERLRAEAVELEERALGPAPEELRRLYADVLLGSVVHDLALVRELAGAPEPGSTDPRGPDGPPRAPRPLPGRAPAARGGLHPAGALRVPAPYPGIRPGLRHGNAPETSRQAPGDHAARWIQAERIDHVDVWPGGARPPSVAFVGTLPGGARLSIRRHYLAAYPAYREEVRVHDEWGTISLVFPSPYLLHAPTTLTVVDGDGGAERTTRFRSAAESFERELEAFHRLVAAAKAPIAGAAEGRVEIETCQRVVRRLAEQRGLELGGEAAA